MVIRENVNASEYKLSYIWDGTAKDKEKRPGERGQIQYYNASTGTLGVMRSTTLEERRNSIIVNYLQFTLPKDPRKTEGKTTDSRALEGLGIQRTDKDGNQVPYQHTHIDTPNGVSGNPFETYTRDVNFSGVTAQNYTVGTTGVVGTFNTASDAAKVRMTAPSASLVADLDALALDYVAGNVRNIRVQITTNRPSSVVGIAESNNLRSQGIVNRLVSQGVDRSSITLESHVYSNATWNANITYDEKK